MAHLHQVERALDIGLELFRALLSHAQAVGHVVEHRHMRPPGVGLEHHGDAAARREAHAVHRHLIAVAHDQVLPLDTRHAHVSSFVTPRVSRNRIASATITVKVWISAIAAVSSVPLEAKAATIDGAITLALGPIRNTEAPSSRTQAMKISSQAASMPGLSSGRVTVRIW